MLTVRQNRDGEEERVRSNKKNEGEKQRYYEEAFLESRRGGERKQLIVAAREDREKGGHC